MGHTVGRQAADCYDGGIMGGNTDFHFLSFYLNLCFCGVCACMHTHARMLVSADGVEKISGPLELELEAGEILQMGVLGTKLARAASSINC